MKKSLFFVSLLAVAATAPAATFSAGGGQGTSIVDAAGTGDYVSLADAAADFSNFASGCTGNWTLLIRSNLTEASSAIFGNNTNGHTVTIKPAPGVSPTVTFNHVPKPAGTWWDGNIVIGPKTQNTGADFMDADNFVVDGSNTANGTTRDLKITNTPPPVTTPATADIPRILVRVVGQADNVVVKNCVLDSVTSGVTDNVGVDFTARRVALTSTDYVPHNGKVQNCEIKVAVGNLGIGVRSANSGSVPSGTAQNGVEVTNCDITASLRAVTFGMNAGGKVANNRLRIQQTAAARPQVISHSSANGATGWTMDITGNQITDVQSTDVGGFLFAIGIGGGVTAGTATYNVHNNTIAGYRYEYTGTTAATATNWICRGISVETAGSTAIYNIYHNSISLPHIAAFATGPDTNNRLGAISLLSAGNFAGTLNLRNNIIRYPQTNGTILSLRPSATGTSIGGTLNINNNTYFADTGAIANLNGTPYATLQDWQQTGRDGASNVSDPTVGTGKWVSATDLHFDAAPGAAYAGVPVGVTTDIDGQVRSTTAPTKGADEFAVQTGVSDWHLF